MTTRFHKQIVEATNLAHERGHIKINISVAGRSFSRCGQYAVLVCEQCSMCSTVREKPYPDESDLEGTLHKQSCNVTTLIADAAEAVEIHGEDELEKSATRCQEFQHRYLHQ